MQDESKCFVCQSQSKLADGSPSGKRRRTSVNYSKLDSSTWKIFCHYFYPPPLSGLYDSSSPGHGNEYQKEDLPLPVFCPTCCRTIMKLCNLHSQLELIQCQISTVVAQVAFAFVQEEYDEKEEENTSNNCDGLSPMSRKLQKRKHQQERCDDNTIYSMRRCIRQRYQPYVSIGRCKNLATLKPDDGGGGGSNDLEVDDYSPPSIHSDDLSHQSDCDADLSQPMTHEAGKGHLNGRKMNINNRNLPAPCKQTEAEEENGVKIINIKRSSKTERINYSESDDQSYSKEDSESDSDYEPDSDDNEPASKKVVFSPKKPKHELQPQSKFKEQKEKSTNGAGEGPSLDKKVGENTFEYDGKWRYEKKLDEHGKSRFYCLSCDHDNKQKDTLIKHIRIKHMKDSSLRGFRTKKIDENNFTYDDIYTITKVTEPNGIFYKCGTCGVLRRTIQGVKNHLNKDHIDVHRWVCEQCGYTASMKYLFGLHMETHGEVGKYVCETCGKLMRTKNEMKSHKQFHSGKSWVCECGKKFTYKDNLRAHRKSAGHPAPTETSTVVPNGPEKPFAPILCSLCKREFVSEENLQKHMSSCYKRAKVPCDWCGLLFYGQNVVMHKRKNCKERFNHQDPKIVPIPAKPRFRGTCNLCKRRFLVESLYQEHVSVCQGRVKTPCTWCGNMYSFPTQHKRRNCKERFKQGRLRQNQSKNQVIIPPEVNDKEEDDDEMENEVENPLKN